MVNSRRGRTVEVKIRLRKGGRTPGSYMSVFYGLKGRVLFAVAGVASVEIDVAKGRSALAKTDAYVRKRWHRKPEPWREEWMRQVQRWEKILA